MRQKIVALGFREASGWKPQEKKPLAAAGKKGCVLRGTGLPVAAIAGIALGLGVTALGVAVGVWLCFRARRRVIMGSLVGSTLFKNTSDTFRFFLRSGTRRFPRTGRRSDTATILASRTTPVTGSGHTQPPGSCSFRTDSARAGQGFVTTSIFGGLALPSPLGNALHHSAKYLSPMT